MSTASDPVAMFGVDNLRCDAGVMTLDQRLTAAVLDHRGRVEMPAYIVLAESVTSGVYWYSFAESVATVQAWLALTAGAPARVGDDLRAIAELTHRDDEHGTAAMRVTTGDAVVCTGVARAVRVGRNTEALRAIDKNTLGGTVFPALRPTGSSTAPAPIDPDWDGARILSALHRDQIEPGPLSELLALTMTLTEAGPLLEVAPPGWTANPLGAVQGGVMASLLGQACSLAGQAHTGPGDRYTVADLSVHFFRSPLVDAGTLTLRTGTERVGRRLATVSATMVGSDGAVYARAVADIAYDRR